MKNHEQNVQINNTVIHNSRKEALQHDKSDSHRGLFDANCRSYVSLINQLSLMWDDIIMLALMCNDVMALPRLKSEDILCYGGL